jgi:hypothetical protein
MKSQPQMLKVSQVAAPSVKHAQLTDNDGLCMIVRSHQGELKRVLQPRRAEALVFSARRCCRRSRVLH